jgi:protein-S-isoprenylcysteine O-methyltransferase Ste14
MRSPQSNRHAASDVISCYWHRNYKPCFRFRNALDQTSEQRQSFRRRDTRFSSRLSLLSHPDCRSTGGFGPFLAHPPFIAVLVVFVLLLGAAMFTQGNLNPGEREDRGNRWVIWALTGLSVALAYVPAYTDRIGLWTLDGEAMRWIGVVLGAIGGTLRILPVFVLGRRFSGLVAIQKEHRLVTTGIYATIRHPSYLGLLMTVAGWVLVFRSGMGLIIAALFVPIILGRIRAEERLLASQFGAEYEAYRARTSRLVPRVY